MTFAVFFGYFHRRCVLACFPGNLRGAGSILNAVDILYQRSIASSALVKAGHQTLIFRAVSAGYNIPRYHISMYDEEVYDARVCSFPFKLRHSLHHRPSPQPTHPLSFALLPSGVLLAQGFSLFFVLVVAMLALFAGQWTASNGYPLFPAS